MTTSSTRSKSRGQSQSLHTHKPAPSFASLFSLELAPFEPPQSFLGAFLWRKRMWFETTFGLSVFEPWEKILFMIIFMTITTLIATAFVKILPAQLVSMYHRTLYYLLGLDATPALALPISVPNLNWTTHYFNAHALKAPGFAGKL
ncbi:hypothetical protein EVG20_g11660 [Dentipellis fragilis]|uniref:Uncharacterized protein n=1 Tax=Dentipellis fragilis TaxID=205917 RepID=A0A4Y9XLY8_9AGAM|nr:hypothetical protein EVG20_g11660 [Dentipellis fragilis]